MIPNPQAAQQATVGLAILLQDTDEDYSETPAAILGKKIRDRQELNPLEVSKLRDFHFAPPRDASPGWVNACQLYGGQPLKDQIAAVPVDPPKPKATIYAGVRADAATMLQRHSQYACDRIPLAVLGDVQALSEMDLLQAETVCESITAALGPAAIDARWQTQVITAAGYETRITFTHPDLYTLKHQLDSAMNRHGVPYATNDPWVPAVTASLSPVEPADSLFAPFLSTVDRLILAWGETETVYQFTGSTMQPVTAAATDKSVLSGFTKDMTEQLQHLDDRWLTALETVVKMAVNQALEKVGRSVKKNTPEVFMTMTASQMEPTAIAVVANDSLTANVNVSQLIAAPIDDAVKQARDLTVAHIAAVQALIGDRMNLDVNLKNKYTAQLKRSERLLKNRLKDWIQWRVTTPDGEAKLDDFNAVVDPPTSIIRDFAQTAGGDEIAADEQTGVLKPLGTKNFGPALAIGLVGVGLLRRGFDAYKGRSSKQVKLRDVTDGPVSAVVKALTSLTPDSPVTVGERYEWKPNYFGSIKTEHHPDHKPLFGTFTEDPSNVEGRKPGDHPHCKCGWEPTIILAE